MRKWLALFLFGVIILMVVFPVLAIAMEPEYLEYETIVLSTLSNPSDPVIPNWRELYLRKIERYEKFILENGFDLKKIKILTAIIFLNMAPLHNEPFSDTLYHMGQKMLHKSLQVR